MALSELKERVWGILVRTIRYGAPLHNSYRHYYIGITVTGETVVQRSSDYGAASTTISRKYNLVHVGICGMDDSPKDVGNGLTTCLNLPISTYPSLTNHATFFYHGKT